MPVRAALNLTYVLATEGMDTKQREEFDADIHGWNEMNERAQRALTGGED